MVFDNAGKELVKADKSLAVFEKARQLAITESKDIVKECRKSIAISHSANSELPGNQESKLKEAQEKADKAAYLLKKLQKRLKDDYGKSWKQDLRDYVNNPEQEIIEAFSLLAILKQQNIPTREITFRMRTPDSYQTKKDTIKISRDSYIFGLLDCVGELKRVAMDSLNRNDSDFANKIYKLMQEMFKKLESFTQYSNSVKYLKPKIDSVRYSLTDVKKLLTEKKT